MQMRAKKVGLFGSVRSIGRGFCKNVVSCTGRTSLQQRDEQDDEYIPSISKYQDDDNSR